MNTPDDTAAPSTRALYGSAATGLAATMAVTLAVVVVAWSRAPVPSLLAWAGVVIALCAWRGMLLRRFRREAPSDAELGPWRRRFLASVTALGATLGLSWWVIAAYLDEPQRLLLMLVLGGLAVGAVPVLSASLRAYCIYATLVCMPAIAWLLSRGDSRHLLMGALGLCLMLAIMASARTFHRNLLESLRLTGRNRLLLQQQARLRDFARLGADLFWECDAAGRFTYLSEGYEQLTGLSAASMIGRSVDTSGLPRFVPPASRRDDHHDAGLSEYEDHTASWTAPDGRRVVLRCAAVSVKDDPAILGGLRGTVRDVTREHELSRALEHQANHDPLTDLVNRREFERRLGALLQRHDREHESHALFYMDLDRFKHINDSCGHIAGDALLRQLAGVLRGRLRTQDTLARLGGDEFGVLLERCDESDARAVAEGIRGAVEGLRFQWRDRAYRVSASIGAVVLDDTWRSAAEAMMAADAACYASKDGGRNRVHVHSGESDARSAREGEMHWARRITHALDHDGLALVAMPIIALRSRRHADSDDPMEHFEVLLRLRGDDRELIAPAAFMPAAERYGLATRLDTWVVDAALRWVDTHRSRVRTCCINLSGHAVVEEDFRRDLLDRLRARPGLAERLCFELTETTALVSLEQTAEFMRALRAQGCRFALDDFGAGLSSFGYLKGLPVDYLKIDGAHIRGMAAGEDLDRAMVRSIQEVARILGKRTIAECVEDPQSLEPLRAMGVNFAQGYALGRPRDLDDVATPLSAKVIHIRR